VPGSSAPEPPASAPLSSSAEDSASSGLLRSAARAASARGSSASPCPLRQSLLPGKAEKEEEREREGEAEEEGAGEDALSEPLPGTVPPSSGKTEAVALLFFPPEPQESVLASQAASSALPAEGTPLSAMLALSRSQGTPALSASSLASLSSASELRAAVKREKPERSEALQLQLLPRQ